MLIINPDFLAGLDPVTRNLIAAFGFALIVIGVLLIVYDFTGFSPRRAWFHIKPYGIAVHYHDFLNIGGSADDLRLVMFVAHFVNRTWREIDKVEGVLRNELTGEQKPIFINMDGGLHPPDVVSFIPKWQRFRVMVPFGTQQGQGLDQQAQPRVEDGLQRLGALVFEVQLDRWRVRKRFSERKVLKQANKTLNKIRRQQRQQHRRSSTGGTNRLG